MNEFKVMSLGRVGRGRLSGICRGSLGLTLMAVCLALAVPGLADDGKGSPQKNELTRDDIIRAMNKDQKQRPRADWTWDEISKAAGKNYSEEDIRELEKGDPSSEHYVPVWERRKPVTPPWEKK